MFRLHSEGTILVDVNRTKAVSKIQDNSEFVFQIILYLFLTKTLHVQLFKETSKGIIVTHAVVTTVTLL